MSLEKEELMDRVIRGSLFSTVINIGFGVCYPILAFLSGSLWLLILGVYYLMLGIIELLALSVDEGKGLICKIAGWVLMTLSATMVGAIVTSVILENGYRFHLILILAIASFAFSKITLATINLIKVKRLESEKITVLRSVSFVDGLISIFALQRSMIATFDGMSVGEALVMNLALGIAVSAAVFLVGIRLVIGSNKIASNT